MRHHSPDTGGRQMAYTPLPQQLYMGQRWRTYFRLVAGLACLCMVPIVAAREVGGVVLPDSAVVSGKQLVLNGAGVRRKFFVRIYACALYLEHATSDAHAAIAMDGAKQLRIHFVHDRLSQNQITSAWNDGFEANHEPPALSPLAQRIAAFNALWPELVAGDQAVLSFDPSSGTDVQINGVRRGMIPGRDFFAATLRIWLGENPVDGSLKRDLLTQ